MSPFAERAMFAIMGICALGLGLSVVACVVMLFRMAAAVLGMEAHALWAAFWVVVLGAWIGHLCWLYCKKHDRP